MLNYINWFDFVIYFCSGIILISSYYYSTKILLNNPKITIFKKIFFLFFLAFLGATLYFFVNFEIRILINFILLLLGINFTFNQNIKNSILISLILTIFMFIIELLLSTIFIFSFIPIDIIENITISMVFNIIVSLGVVLLSYKSKPKINTILDWYTHKDNISFILSLVIILIIGINLMTNNYHNTTSTIPFIINSLIIIFILYISIILIKEHFAKSILENKLKFEKDYNKSYKTLVDDYAKKLHENNNDWTIVYGLIQFDHEKAKDFIKTITNYKNEMNEYWWLSSINNLKDPGLIMLIYYKLVELEKANIKINLGVESIFTDYTKLSALNIEKFNFLYKMIGVFFDNAIESLKITREKFFNFEVYEEDDIFYFIIENSYEGTITNESTKGKNRGHGLKLVQDLNTQFDDINYNTIIKDSIFTQEILIDFNN